MKSRLAIATLAGLALLVGLYPPAAHAFAHRRHGMLPGMRAVWVVLQPSQRAKAREIFTAARPSLKKDHLNLMAARRQLAQALVGGGDVASAERNLEKTRNAFFEDRVRLAQKVVALLSPAQRAAASKLLANLEKTHEQIRGYFQQARRAASASTSQ